MLMLQQNSNLFYFPHLVYASSNTGITSSYIYIYDDGYLFQNLIPFLCNNNYYY